jgi:23S rRNA (cytosine1962-C5)-methyltransferase
MRLPKVILLPGREKSILRKHPWIFSGAIKNVTDNPSSGGTVEIISAAGIILGAGAYSNKSQIRVRAWSYNPDENIDRGYFREKIKQAILTREMLPNLEVSNSRRLIYGENDGLPGVIADKFGDIIVLQLSTTGAYHWRETIIHEIVELTKCKVLFEKSDSDINQLEGLDDVVQIQYGLLDATPVIIEENGLNYLFEIEGSQKTGFYLDQRNNRKELREYSENKKVLDCFCFSGGFTMNALKGGASNVIAVDSSDTALRLARENLKINNFDEAKVELVNDNAFEYLRKLRDRDEQFDLIILDPPKFAPTTSQVERAARAYKDINLLAFKLLSPNGVLFTFSCSGGVGLPLFQKIVADAVLDAGKNVQIIKFLHQAEDHPISSTFPEGEYLKGLVCKVTGR